MGIVLGKKKGLFRDKLVEYDGTENVLALGSCRTGKTAGIVIPTLFKWKKSAVVIDHRSEIAEITTKAREKMGQEVIWIFPNAKDESYPHTITSYNPLAEIRLDTEFEYGDVSDVVEILLRIEKNSERRLQSARLLMICAVLHLLHVYKNKGNGVPTLKILSEFILRGNEEYTLWSILNEMNHKPVYPMIPELIVEIHKDIDMYDCEMIMQIIGDCLKDYCTPTFAKNLESNESLIDKIINNDSNITVYLMTHSYEDYKTAPLFAIFSKQLIKRKKIEKQEEKDLLLVIDEAVVLGPLDWLEQGSIDKTGIQLLMTLQSINQCNKMYSSAKILEQFKIKVITGVNDANSPMYISELSQGELTLEDVYREKELLLFVEGKKFQRVHKTMYWKEKVFKNYLND